MTDDTPKWLPEPATGIEPEAQQAAIIESDAYPMRVLAGAGTGKTFTMVRKIEHLIEHEGVSPDRILALTFTNNAAGSMREKLTATLGTAGYEIDAYTYHSICNELLTEYAYVAGIDPEFEVVIGAEKDAILLDVLDEIEYRWVKPNVYGPDSHGNGAVSKLRSFIGSMKRSGIRPADIDAFLAPAEDLYDLESLPERIETMASEHLGGRSVSSVRDSLPDGRAELAVERDALGESPAERAIVDYLTRLIELCDALELAFEAHETGDRTLPDAVHKLPKYLLGGYSSGAPAGIPNLNLELTDQLESYIEDCLVACDLVDGYAAYERELNRRDLFDFDGLVVGAVDLLSGDVRDEIASRWDYVFCDEFQDTDHLQFDLVTSLVTDGRQFVVGDDDQAIYEWRGARVSNITSALTGEYGTTLTDQPLEENFRSRQPILDLANDLISSVDGREQAKTLTRVDEPEYDGETIAIVEEAEAADDRAHQLLTVTQNLLSGAAAELDEAYDPGDIALLVRKNKHAVPVLDAFDGAGIPYQVAGDLASESVGVGTVVAYLKALARPEEDDVSWNRILTMRYRLTDGDLRRLNEYDEDDGSLLDNLQTMPLSAFDEPVRIEDVRSHVDELFRIRNRASLASLYSELKDITNIEWYLSEQERRDLQQLDEVVGQYGQEDVQPPLTTDFIESLQHHDSLFAESGSTPTAEPELADDAVNVMTIHKSKGLDFPVVLVPRLTAAEWKPGSRAYDAFEAGLTDGPTAVFDDDHVARDANETRRLLHVAITRAEDVLVLQGGREDEADNPEDPHPIADFLTNSLPSCLPWRPGRSSLPIWHDIQACLPAGTANWTETLASDTRGDVGGTVQYEDDSLDLPAARSRVLQFASASIGGELESKTETRHLQVDTLTGPITPLPSISHSYTSLDVYDDCPRQHYLDYVVNAFPDYQPAARDATDGVSQREIGLLFHDTAEQAAILGTREPTDWHEISERLARQQRVGDALEPAQRCIDRYFELDVSEYELIDAEREFELDVDGHALVGFIDALYRTPDDELLVIDYKATARNRDIETDKQLPIYVLAARKLYDESVRRAGYAYVGEIGPAMEIRAFEESELDALIDEITSTVHRIADFSYDAYRAGEHCQWCQHNRLPCAPDSIRTE